MTQTEKILTELKKGRKLSRRQIRDELNINSETARISELRDEGHNILDCWKISKNGKRYKVYMLGRKF